MLAILALVASACATTTSPAPGSATATGVPPTTAGVPTTTAGVPTTTAGVPTSPPSTSTPLTSPTHAGGSAPAAKIRIALATARTGGPFGQLSNASSPVGDDYQKAGFVDQFVYAALLRADALERPVPDLATSCEPDGAGTTITCRLRQAAFQNGRPVTADDVAFTYRLVAANTGVDDPYRSPCIDVVLPIASGCVSEVLDGVDIVDPATVAFHLKQPYAPFMTLVLPWIWIDSRDVVMQAYNAFRAAAAGTDPATLVTAADGLTTIVDTPSADCARPLDAPVALLWRTGLLVPDRADYNGLQGGAFDACAYALEVAYLLRLAASSLTHTGDAAIAAAYRGLAFNRKPVGAGPYRVADLEPGRRVVLEADPGYHGGPVATQQVEFDFTTDVESAVAAVRSGSADWTEVYYDAIPGLDRDPNLHVGLAPLPGLTEMVYNVRPGRLFSDVNLRRAVNLCIDKSAMTRAAAGTAGFPALTDLASGWWGFDANLPAEHRDVAAARKLIESSGWQPGDDGIYRKDGRRLAATVYLRTDAPDRVRFVNLMSLFARDCGMDLKANQEDFGGALATILSWPNTPPGSKEPFDLYLLGWVTGLDPMPLQYTSAEVTRADDPNGINFGGFSNADLDRIVADLDTTYDLDRRADLYRQYQEIVLSEQPALFAYGATRQIVLRPGLARVNGPVDLSAMNWSSAPEQLVLGT
jgi:ABC-type transport system substrate-binding protein